MEIQCIRHAIADLASLEDEVLLRSLGVPREDITLLLSQCDYNWFEFTEQLPLSTDAEILFNEVSKLEFSSQALQLIEQSHLAYLVAEKGGNHQEQIARTVNGEIVSQTLTIQDLMSVSLIP